MSASNQPDRFGCGTVALTLLEALVLLAALLGLLVAGVLNMANAGLFNPGAFGQNAPNPGNGAVTGPGGTRAGAGNGQAAVDAAGDGQPPVIAAISDRSFSSGSVTTVMSGGPFTPSGTFAIDPEKAYAKDGLGWIAFASGPTDVLISINEPENAIAVAQGDMYATAQDDACAWDVHVTDNLVSGHVSCPSVPVVQGTTTIGTTSIELDFSAGSSGADDPVITPEPDAT